MAIAPISPISITGPLQVGNVTAAAPSGGTAGAGGAGGIGSFADALDNLTAAQTKADDLALQAATGDLQALHDYTIASTEAQLLTQLTVTVRNRAVEAFNDIMRMQV
ncbi:MAG: flagellar hook-basal body complex protein FliE [Acidimicrobiia bacterium]